MSKKQPSNSWKDSLGGLTSNEIQDKAVLSPDLFNQYSKFNLRELEKVGEGIQVNGRCINSIYEGQ